MKPKLSFADLVNKFHERNISNGSYTDNQIIEYLQTRSYYYKIASYRKNYPKNPQGKGYSHLTFDHLIETAKLDVRLREYLLGLCLDVEHATKTKLMTILTDDEGEDGYSIVESFRDENSDKFEEILRHFRNNHYKKDMFQKRDQISVWVLMEIIDYGTLIRFLEFYKGYKLEDSKNLYAIQHKFIKNIRNACAHNDVYLINIFDANSSVHRPQPAIRSFADSMGVNTHLIRYQKTLDIVALFYIHAKLCSDELIIEDTLRGKRS